MTSTQTIIEHAELRCKNKGVRLTTKRKHILSGLLDSEKAMSAYELADYCKEQFDYAIPAMSVYRILDFLQEEHLAHKLKLANKYVACSHITCKHEHQVPQFLICSNCQSVKEINIERDIIDRLDTNVSEAGYTLLTPQLEMNCLCSTCTPQ